MANVTVLNGTMDEKEINGYIDIIEKENPSRKLDSLELTIDGDFVNRKYTFKPINIERIRRITCYLVGTMDRCNDAKTSEEHDSAKRSLHLY